MGWLHLDLKLNNVLVGSSDMSHERAGSIYLIDFGISELIYEDLTNHRKQEDRSRV